MKEKENVLDILVRTKKAISENDVVTMKLLSNRTIHSSSIYQDPDNIAVAVIVYALGKIIERKKYQEYKEWPAFFSACMASLDAAIAAIKSDNIEQFRESVENIREAIELLSGHLRSYIEEVFRKASINKASRIYEHGISMQQTASLLGISVFELAEYAGKTGIGDVDLSITKNIHERLKTAFELFE